MTRYEPYAYSLLRIITGVFFTMHGTMKLLGWPSAGATAEPLPAMMVAAGTIEILAGLLIVLGLFTRPAAFIASGTMAAAFFIAHFPHGWNPLINQGELAAVYAFLFLLVSLRGGGEWSLDAVRVRSK